jgi:hypothetical protein
MLCFFSITFAQEKNSAQNAFVGRLQRDEATVKFLPTGTITINGEKFNYKIKNTIITDF